MKLTKTFAQGLSKALFSAVIVHLFCILLGAQNGAFTPLDVLEMLEYSATGAAGAIAASLLMEYILREQNK